VQGDTRSPFSDRVLKHHWLVVLALVVSCTKQEPLLIGFVGGSGTPDAARMAAEDVNANGGINGRTLELVVVEESYLDRPGDALAVAERLSANARVLAVVGHGGSGTSLAASQVYNARHVPQLAPTTSSPLYSKAGPYSYSMVANDLHQARFIASSIAAMKPVPRVAVLYVIGDYGRALSGAFRVAATTAGVPLVYEAAILEGTQFNESAGEIVTALSRAKPELLVWIARPEELAILRSRLGAARSRLRILGSDALGSFRELGDSSSFDGVLLVSYVDLDANRASLRSVATRYRARTGFALGDAAALAYDAVAVAASALRRGASTRSDLRDSLASGRSYEGITGRISFDSNGDAQPSFHLFEIAHGKLEGLPPH
jgi:branched-chain amino acid transport system substrate-binding protein